MAIQHLTTGLYKVVNINADRYSYGGKFSALLHQSRAKINYDTERLFVEPSVPGTPVLAFNDLAKAFAFADKFPGRRVYELEAYGEIVPVERVLKIKNRGWDMYLTEFWSAVQAGADLSRFTTLEAQPGSVAIFGVVRLGRLANRPNAVPAATPEVMSGSAQNSQRQREGF